MYHETDEYVDSLVTEATERAIRRRKKRRNPFLVPLKYAAAVAIVAVVGISIFYSHSDHSNNFIAKASDTSRVNTISQRHQACSPLDAYLSSMSDEQACEIIYCDDVDEYLE